MHREPIGSTGRPRSGPAHVRACLSAVVAILAVCSSAVAQAVDLSALDRYIESTRVAWDVPGLAVAIVKDGEVVLAKGYGVRELGGDDPVDEHTLFAIASNTKAFTVASLAMLVDAGRLDWDDRVVDHLPWFRLYSPYVTQDMRIRDLLCHRSGLGIFSGDLLWYRTTYDREEVIRRARYLEQAGPFRQHYGYNNVMFLVAGEVIEAVTDTSWSAFIEQHFFGPLGMDRSVTSGAGLAERANVATPHGDATPHAGDGFQWVTYPWVDMESRPSGSIISSVSDMARWIRLQLAGGTLDGRTFFSEEAQREMWTPHVSFTVGAESQRRFPSTHFRGYGLGWSLFDYRGRKVVGHGGALDGMYSRVALVPEEGLGLVILTNGMTALQEVITYRILDAYLGGEPRDWSPEFKRRSERAERRWKEYWAEVEREHIPGTQPSRALDAYTGTYGGELYGDARVVLDDGRLVLELVPAPDLLAELDHWHYDTFRLRWRERVAWWGDGFVQFILNEHGDVVELKLNVPNEDFWFSELEFERRDGME